MDPIVVVMKVLILTLLSLSVNGSMKGHLELIIAVRRHFNAKCIRLLYNGLETLNREAVTTMLTKEMSKNNIQVTVIYHSDSTPSCYDSRPLYVLTENDSHLEQEYFARATWFSILETRSIIDFFYDKPVPFDCEFLVAEEQDGHVIPLTEVYRIAPTLPLQTNKFGHWNSSGGLREKKFGLYDRRNNLFGTVFNTTVIKDSPLYRSEATQLDTPGTFYVQVWMTFKELLNFTPAYLPYQNNMYGERLENGSWSGILGVLQRKEAEVTCEEMSIMPNRAEVVDFMFTVRTQRYGLASRLYVLIKQTDNYNFSWTTFLQPFSTEIWMAMLLTIVIVAFVLWIIKKGNNLYSFGKLDGAATSFSLADAFFYVLGSICQQGQHALPQSTSGRLVYLSSYVTAVVLLAGYSASLTSYLALRKPVTPFTTFKGFLQDGSYKFLLQSFSSAYFYFKETKDPLLHELYTRFISPHHDDFPETNMEGLRRVCQSSKVTFLASKHTVDQYSENLTCRLTTVKQAYLPGSTSMAMSKGSPYLGLFSHSLLKMRSSGILHRLKIHSSKQQPIEASQFITVDVISVVPIFAVLAFGMILSLLILSIELVFHHKRNKRYLYKTNLSKRARKIH